MKNKYFVAINPNSGAGKAGKDWDTVKNKLHKAGILFDFAISEKHKHSVEQTRDAIKAGFRKIITVGGDGTLHHVVNGIYTQTEVEAKEIEVGMISIGTGNDWVRHYGIPKKYDKAISTILKGNTKLQDVGKLQFNNYNNTEYFMNFVGVGYDAYVVEHTVDLKQYGEIAYLYGLIQCLFKYSPQKLKIEIDGKAALDEEVYMLIAGLGKYAGGGMMLSPSAKIDDGYFDLTIGKNLSKAEIALMTHKLFSGKYVEHEKVETHKCKNLKISPYSDEVKSEADGELIGTGPFEISLIENGLKVYTV